MGSQTPRTANASAEETRAYIADMAEQLAHMAADLGDHATAETLREARRVAVDHRRRDREELAELL